MFYKFFISIFMVLFVAACATTPKDSADSSGSGSSSSGSDVSSEGTITETAGSGIVSGSQEDLIVNVGDRVFFGYDSSDLDSDALELLQDQVAWLKQNSDVSQAVKNYLIGLGINPDRVSTISYGKERPAVVGSNDGAWAQNRRSVTLVN